MYVCFTVDITLFVRIHRICSQIGVPIISLTFCFAWKKAGEVHWFVPSKDPHNGPLADQEWPQTIQDTRGLLLPCALQVSLLFSTSFANIPALSGISCGSSCLNITVISSLGCFSAAFYSHTLLLDLFALHTYCFRTTLLHVNSLSVFAMITMSEKLMVVLSLFISMFFVAFFFCKRFVFFFYLIIIVVIIMWPSEKLHTKK